MLKISKILQSFATNTLLKPPIPLKKPPPPINNGMSTNSIAQKLNISESTLRKQMVNPKSNTLSQEELQLVSIINGVNLNSNEKYQMKKKSPVVTIMGHVDHGKTSLIDYLRKSDIAGKQHGGITQKIGAFHIQCQGQKITFIDTPGHEAFTNMRERGAKSTDLVVLIVSATEGVKKQTTQIIKIITEKKVACIVAINKLDLPNADPESCQKSLHEAGLQLEPFGGHIPVVHISAKTGQNIDLLSQLIIEETRQITAIHDGTVEGMILEARKNSQGLNAVTMIIQKGTLRPGSFIIMGDIYTKVKQMRDDRGNVLLEGVPGDAVQILGLSQVPKAGQIVYQVKDQKKAKFILTKRKEKQLISDDSNTKKDQISSTKITKMKRKQKKAFCRGFSQKWLQHYKLAEQKILEQIQRLQSIQKSQQIQQLIFQRQLQLQNHRKYVEEYLMNTKDKPNALNVILKFSNRGIQQTILQQLESIAERIKKTYDITINILNTDIGDTTLTDIKNAKLSNAEILTFGVSITGEASEAVLQQNIKPKNHELIHTFLKDIDDIAIKRKRSSIKGIQRGFGQIIEKYSLKKGKKGTMQVVGLKVIFGKLEKKNKFYIFRGGVPITQPLYADFIRVFKNDEMEVKKGQQCTISFNDGQFNNFQKGDQIYCFEE